MVGSRKFLCGILSALLLLPGIQIISALTEEAAEMHHNSIVIDTHNDTMMKVIDNNTWLPSVDIGDRTDFQLDLEKAASGGLNVAFFAAFANYQGDGPDRMARTNSKTLSMLNALHWSVGRNSDRMAIGTSPESIEKGMLEGKLVAVPTLEGAYALNTENAIELLHQYYDLGVRSIGIVWNHENALGAGTTGPSGMGLTNLGSQVLQEMNRLGVIIDVSHMNEKTFHDTLSLSVTPVMASHSGASGVRAHVRNLTDAQLVALKENGGVAQVNFWNTALAYPDERADLAKLVDHIDYIAGLIGVDHVGLGSDFDGADMPLEMENASKLPALTNELMARGYSGEEIKKILGGNTMRIIREVQEYAEHTEQADDQAIVIDAFMKMGSETDRERPRLMAKVRKQTGIEIDESGFRVIVDGRAHVPYYDARTGFLYFRSESLLSGGNFHVVTFEGKNKSGIVTRETVIFYIR